MCERVGGVAAVVALAGASTFATAVSQAQSPPAGAEAVEFAASEHQRGYQAYTGKHYEQAAIHFENAFFSVPNPSELRSAIRARRDAKEYARAATLSALGERKYPDDGAMTRAADEAIADAKPRVQELTIACDLECGVIADGKVVTIETAKEIRLFLDPGHHSLAVSFGDDRSKSVEIDAKAGASDRRTVAAPPKAPPAPTASAVPVPLPPAPTQTATARPPAAPPPPESSKPLGTSIFWAGVGFTVAAGGATAISGLEAQKHPGTAAVRADCVGQGTSCPEYQQGLSAQLRTNILIGVTGGLGVVTAIVGLFLTQWGAPEARPAESAHAHDGVRVEPVVGFGVAGVRGSF
jgi:hypothetical protein